MMPFPMYQTPPPAYPAPQPRNAPPAPQAWQAAPPAPNPVLAAQAATFNQPRVRGYAPEAPAPKAFPTPEQLGLSRQPPPSNPLPPPRALPMPASPDAVAVDWNAIHERLRQLGASGFHLERLPAGATRVSVSIPTAGESRLVEAIASSDAIAIATLFERIADR